MISESKKDWLAHRMKITEEGLNSLRPFYWPIIISQSTFFTTLKVANSLGLPEAFTVGAVMVSGGAFVASFIYLTYSWDLHNRMAKVDEDISSNYASPTTMINQEVGAEQQAKNIELWSRIVNGEDVSYEDALEEIMPVTQKAIRERRNGVEVEDYDET